MDYELAKKLKKAGYPQPDITTMLHRDKMWFRTEKNEYYIPTLSELIEACGEGLEVLMKIGEERWEAGLISMKSYTDFNFKKPFGRGKTPIEAVANLYLALCPKK